MLQYKVLNNEPRYHSVSYGGDIKQVRKIVLSPGANLLSEKEYDAIKNHPYFKKRLVEKVKGQIGLAVFSVKEIKLEGAEPVAVSGEQEPVSLPSSKPALSNLSGMTIKDAHEVLEETFDVNVLERWAQEENRSTLKLQISKRLEKVLQDADSGKGKAGEGN